MLRDELAVVQDKFMEKTFGHIGTNTIRLKTHFNNNLIRIYVPAAIGCLACGKFTGEYPWVPAFAFAVDALFGHYLVNAAIEKAILHNDAVKDEYVDAMLPTLKDAIVYATETDNVALQAYAIKRLRRIVPLAGK